MKALGTSIGLVAAGIAIAWFAPFATGPKIGMAVFLVALGITIFLVSNVEAFLRKTTKPEDYEGTCPVGESCPECGAFNYKPKKVCRSCGGPVNQKVL